VRNNLEKHINNLNDSSSIWAGPLCVLRHLNMLLFSSGQGTSVYWAVKGRQFEIFKILKANGGIYQGYNDENMDVVNKDYEQFCADLEELNKKKKLKKMKSKMDKDIKTKNKHEKKLKIMKI